jgi:hypothetical protein
MFMNVESEMIYRTPDIDWAVMQVYDASSNQVINVLDSRYQDPSTSFVDEHDQVTELPTSYLMGTNAFRLILVSGTNYQYSVYGAQGNQIPEIPTVMTNAFRANKTNSTEQVSFGIKPGEVGHYLTLQASTDLVNWANLLPTHTNYFYGFDPDIHYSETNALNGNSKRFFRLLDQTGPF